MSHLLGNPFFRYGVGLAGATGLVLVAFLFLDGPLRLAVLGIAVLDIVVTPQVLKRAAS